MKNNDFKKILFVGGGTLGSVVPLINVWKKLSQRTDAYDALWIGSKIGPEIDQVKSSNIQYYAISSGKFRRYFSYNNFIDPFKILIGFFESYYLLRKLKPSIVVGAGSFLQVPVCYAAFLLKIPVVIYQMDVRVGLANLLCSKIAKKIAVALPEIMYPWSVDKQVLVGAVSPAIKGGGASDAIVVLGGGTGAKAINDVVSNLVSNMPKEWKVFHVCGKGKINKKLIKKENYYQYESLSNNEMLEAIKNAKVVVSRAGMGTLFEIGALGKPAIIIPISRSHQEDNASYYAKKEAIIVINQDELSDEVLIKEVEKIIIGEYSYLQKNIATITNYDGVDKLGALILNCI